MSYNNLKIPESQRDNFKFFLNLPDVVRNQLIEIIQQAPIGLSDSALYDYITDNIENLSKEKISNFLSIYTNLAEAKEDIGYNDNEFIEDLTNALLDTKDSDLIPTEKSMSIFKSLLNSDNNIHTSRKIQNEHLENEKNYLYSKVLVDIRPVFDKEQLIGSTILNKLKITFSENEDEKNIFLTLDENDIIELIDNLKKAQEQNNYIQNNFNNLKVINIS